MKLIRIDKNTCDVFYGVDEWYDTEWCRFRKNKRGVWENIAGPRHYLWYDKKAKEMKTILSKRPTGSVLRYIYQMIREEYE